MRKSIYYSQNFLINKNLIASLIAKASITHEDIVYDIGAGEGVITEELAKHCRKVIAIEIDNELYKKLTRKFTQISSVELHQANFLRYTLPTSDYKVFSNIPFIITADVIKKLTNALNPPKDTYLVVQREAAKKFVGRPVTNETYASLFIKPWFEPSIVYQFKRKDFSPIPQVDIVFLRLKLRDKPLVVDMKFYKDFIAFAFSQWKPTLQDGLKAIFTKEQFSRLSRDLDFPLQSTPTQLSFNQWLGLYRYLLSGVSSNKKELVVGTSKKLFTQQKHLQKIHRTRVAKNWRSTTHN